MDMPDADLISLNSVDGNLNLQQNENAWWEDKYVHSENR